jgi:hypothetical protein
MIPSMKVPSGARGEWRLYRKLQEKLPEAFFVFHRLEYASVAPEVGLITGEVDFLIVHQEHGLLAVEVKGGDKIEFKPASGSWHSWDHTGKRYTIKDPFKQAKDNIFSLVDKIHASRIFGKKGSRLPFSYGYSVSFPDARVSCQLFPPECPRELVIDASDLPRLGSVVNRILLSIPRREKRPGMDNRQFDDLLNKVLMPEYKVARSVGLEVQEEEEDLIRMTEEQCRLLDFLGDRKQALVEGYAGTGKTFLAVEKAKRLALEGNEVLLLCFNRPLAEHLSQVVGSSGDWSQHVEVDTFHNLCIESAKKAELEFEVPSGDDRKEAESFWRDTTPFLLLEAAEEMGLEFDAVIIDEGQDFAEDWFSALTQLLRSEKNGYFYIFYDPMQDIYRKETSFPIEGPPFPLTRNCRNTRRIANFVSLVGDVHYQKWESVVDGRKVQTWLEVSSEAMIARVDELVVELIESEVVPSQIVILSPYKKGNSCMAGRKVVGGVKLSEDVLSGAVDSVRFSTLKRFKGLEADAVIVCDVNGARPACDRYNQYTAVSRAKHLLHVIHSEEWIPPKTVRNRHASFDNKLSHLDS